MQLPDALSMIDRSVRAGITVQDALRVVGEEGQWPTSAEFQRLNDEIRVGASLSEAIAAAGAAQRRCSNTASSRSR